MAQSVKHPILDFGSGHVLMVVRSSPTSGSMLSVALAWDSLLPSLSALTPLILSLKIKINLKK